MNPFKFPFALLAFMGFVMVLPVWSWFLDNYTSPLSPQAQFLATLVLPALVSLFIASWIQPRGG